MIKLNSNFSTKNKRFKQVINLLENEKEHNNLQNQQIKFGKATYINRNLIIKTTSDMEPHIRN